MRYEKEPYFKYIEGVPTPVVADITRRVHFSEVDPMGIVWFGRYANFFEEGAEEIGRICGLSYRDFFREKLRAPIVKCHIDYYESLYLDEEFIIRTALIWHKGARINKEYTILKENGAVAAGGYTVQLLTDNNGQLCIIPPDLLKVCKERWLRGEFHCQK